MQSVMMIVRHAHLQVYVILALKTSPRVKRDVFSVRQDSSSRRIDAISANLVAYNVRVLARADALYVGRINS